MKYFLTLAMAAALAGSSYAYDDHKKEIKSETVDPVTGEKIKTKTKGKADEDGEFETKSKTKVDGRTVKEHKAERDEDGDYKAKTKVKTGDKKYESKTKIDN
jgi:hypothetical protein